MTRSTPLWRTIAAIGAAGLVLTACGGDPDVEEPDAGTDPGTETTEAAEPTEEATAEETETAAAAPMNESNGVLTLGTLLPQTGNLAFLGPPEFAGVQLAVNEINEAGGVLGEDVELINTDSGDTSTDIASQSVQQLLGQNVDAIIGAASSGVSLTVIDAITGAGVLQISPANTSPEFTTYDDNDLYFRTAPSDVLQGRVHGNLVADAGAATLGLIVIDDSYGNGLADYITENYEASGGTVVARVPYDPNAPNFTSVVSEVLAADPAAISLIAFDETIQIIPEMQTQGYDLTDVYFVDGNLADYSAEFEPGTLEGALGTLPGSQPPADFQERLLGVDPELTSFAYGPESYDAAVVVALGAVAAETDEPSAIAAELVGVTGGGTACTTFAECQEMLTAGEDIDYNGISGPIEFNDAGDPTTVIIGVYEFNAENVPVFQEGVETSLEE